MKKVLNEKDLYKTSDLALAAAILLSYPIEVIDKTNSSRACFLFKREEGLDALIEAYWKGELKVEPKIYFHQLKILKTRLYEEENWPSKKPIKNQKPSRKNEKK